MSVRAAAAIDEMMSRRHSLIGLAAGCTPRGSAARLAILAAIRAIDGHVAALVGVRS